MTPVATQTPATGTGQLALATGFVDGDQILVTLTAEKPGGERIALSYAFNSEGEQVNNKGQAIGGRSLSLGGAAGGDEPQFPTEAYRAALIQGQDEGENDSEADRIMAQYKADFAAYQGRGGAPITQRIANGVFSFLEAEQGVRATDHAGLVLKPEEVVVRAPVRRAANEPGVWLVQLAPTWGW